MYAIRSYYENIGSGDYPYLARYTYSKDNAQYQFGDTFYTTIRPEGYVITSYSIHYTKLYDTCFVTPAARVYF